MNDTPILLKLAIRLIARELRDLVGEEEWPQFARRLVSLVFGQLSSPTEEVVRLACAAILDLFDQYPPAIQRLREVVQALGDEQPIQRLADTSGQTTTDIDQPAPPRYLQSRLSSQHPAEEMTDHSPLALGGGAYTLEVRIGPGQGDAPWPDDVLVEAYEKEGTLSLQVRATSRHLEVTRLDDSVLWLAQQGCSNVVRFRVVPHQPGRAELDVDVFYKGNLIQRQQMTVTVVERVGQTPPESAWPAQTRQTVYTISTLSQEALARWEERVVHITVERDFRERGDGSYIFRFRQGEQDLLTCDSDQVELSLAQLVPGARAELGAAAEAYSAHPDRTAARSLLARWLPRLAYQGARLYEAVLPNAPASPLASLARGSVVQVSPIGPRATLPWGLVYDRPLLSRFAPGEGAGPRFLTNKICPDWLDGHNCLGDGCPGADDYEIVCPSGFWGYRFIVEQMPAGIGGHAPPGVAGLPCEIDNSGHTLFNMNVYTDFRWCQDEIKTYAAYAAGSARGRALPFALALAQNRPDFELAMQRAVVLGESPHLIYFYAHGGRDAQKGVYLRLGGESSGDYLTPTDFRALRLVDGALTSRPLVFLNACESVNYGPEAYASFIAYFHAAGACGLVGAECIVWELTARAVAGGFFRRLFDGLPAGEALWATSRELLDNYNPMGLAYSLFASGMTRLARRVG